MLECLDLPILDLGMQIVGFLVFGILDHHISLSLGSLDLRTAAFWVSNLWTSAFGHS